MSINVNDKNIGHATAYAYYKAGGGTMTEAEFTEFMADFGTASQTAVEAAQAALASKNAAQTAATTATNKASEATTAAQTATTKAGEASTSASTATSAKDTAVSASQTATSKATEATTAATTATSAATTATTAKDDAVSAKTAAQTAQTGAETAAASVQSSAAQIATNTSDISELKEDLTTKANIDGSYEDLVSGGAYQIISNMEEVDNTPYGYRTAGGSLEIGDREKLKKIVGGSLAVNQLAGYNATAGSTTSSGVTFTINSDGSVDVSGEASAKVSFNIGTRVDGHAGHVRFVKGCPIGGSTSSYTMKDGYGNVRDIGNGCIDKINSDYSIAQIIIASGYSITGTLKFKPQIFDLTQMFGATIADYVYGMETATAGAGVAWLKAHFPKIFDSGYIPYNAGTLEHVSGLSAHKMVGFNQWDEDTLMPLSGFTKQADGSWYSERSNAVSSNTVIWENKSGYSGRVYFMYDYKWSGTNVRGVKFKIAYTDGTSASLYPEYASSYAHYSVRSASNKTVKSILYDYGSSNVETWMKNVCVNFAWDGERDGEYEPYEEHVYPLDSDVTLRGIYKLDANNQLYADGDEYEADGTVTRRYGIVDLGTLDFSYNTTSDGNYFRCLLPFSRPINNTTAICSKYENGGLTYDSGMATADDKKFYIPYSSANYLYIKDSAYTDAATFKTAMSGVYLIYELATPTTEEADPYTEIQNVSNWGTEEFVTTSLVPVGHETAYQPDLRAKIEVAPESPDGDGLYLMKRENGQNSYVAYLGELPSDPTTDGTYTLKCTVSGGTATKTWEADT